MSFRSRPSLAACWLMRWKCDQWPQLLWSQQTPVFTIGEVTSCVSCTTNMLCFFFSDCLSSLTNFDHKKVPEALNKSQFLPVVFWAETRKLWFPLLVHSSKRHQRSNYYPANQAELMEPGSKFPTLPWVGCLSWSFRKFFSSKIVQDDSKHHTAQSSPFFGWPEE